MALQAGKVLDALNNPYLFKGKSYLSLKDLFTDFFNKKNYATAVEEWASGKFPVWLTQNTNDLALTHKVKELLSIENLGQPDDPLKKAKIQFGILALYIFPEEGFRIDNSKIDENNFTNHISYFLYQKNQESPRKIAATANLIKQTIGVTKFAERLEATSKTLAQYFDIIHEYKRIFGLTEKEENKLLINFNENDFKKLSWSVNTFNDFVHLANEYALIPDKEKVITYIKKYQANTSLSGISAQAKKFIKKYKSASNGWEKVFAINNPRDIESLLILSAPEEHLLKLKRLQFIKIVVSVLLLCVGLIGLLTIPFILPENESSNVDTLRYILQVGDIGNEEFVDFEVIRNEGKYIVAGYTTSFGKGDVDFWLVKLNIDGEIEWSKTIGSEKDEYLTALAYAPDGFVLAGSVQKDEKDDITSAILIKLNEKGNYQWNVNLGAGKKAIIKDLAVIPLGPRAGQIIATGIFYDNQNAKGFFLVGLDKKGNIIWKQVYGNQANAETVGIVAGKHDDLILLLNIPGVGISKDLLIYNYSLTGKFLSEVVYTNFDINSSRLIQVEEDNILLAGKHINLSSGRTYVDIINIDYVGNHLWDRRIIEEDNITPKSLSTFSSGLSGNKRYLLVADAGEINSGKRVLVREISTDGNVSTVWVPDYTSKEEPLFGLVSENKVILGGINFLNNKRKRDLWITRYPIINPEINQ